MKKIAALILAALAASGCTSTTYTDANGAKFSRIVVGTTQTIGKIDMKAGDRSLTVEGYSTQAAELAGAVVAAAVKAGKSQE